MDPARIAELLDPFLGPAKEQRLTTNDLLNISTYIDLLLRWNAHINLTAIHHPEEIVTRHFGESLFAARHLFPKVGHEGKTEKNSSAPALSEAEGPSAYSAVKDFDSVADLGSGAGFPGLPIKLWAPNIALTLIESNHKKATFLRELTRALTLTDVNIQNTRAETLPPSTFHVVTLRAVERFAHVLPIAATLLAPSGRLALLIASSQLDQARSTLPHLSWHSPIPIPQSKSRILLTGNAP
jgi:16S rRNA (guanine527-N7)-methyltransferase